MSHCFHQLWSHLIWAPKYRAPLITPELKWPLYDKIRRICKELGYYLDHVNGTEDHIHLLVELKPGFCISDVVKNIKGITWEWIRREGLSRKYFSWQDGFAAISVSPKDVPLIRNYIRNQEKHHKKESLNKELTLLNARTYKMDNG